MNLYAIKDEVVGFTGSVVTARNDLEITRQFALAINDKEENNQMAKWYKDFSVWCIGDLDRITGELHDATPRLVVRGDSVKEMKVNVHDV